MASPYDFSFRKLMEAPEGTDTDALFTELLRHGPSLFDSLSLFILGEEQNPRVAVLVTLLGKTMDDRAIPMLMKLLDSANASTRRAAANALGWNRAPAALESLDRLSADDPDARVRDEARTAIEEILRDYPGMRSVLRHQQDAASGPHTIEGPASAAQKSPARKAIGQEKLKLIMTLPRLLAFKYRAVPLRFAGGDQLHLAIEKGRERRMITPMSAVTGYSVTLSAWPMERIHEQIEKLYTLGDDDFAAFFDHLNKQAQSEIVEMVTAGIHPNEPASPLDEANDGVEAAQAFLSSCAAMHVASATIFLDAATMIINATRRSGEVAAISLPPVAIRSRFMKTLMIAARHDAATNVGTLAMKHAGRTLTVDLTSVINAESEKLALVFNET
ncbi:HEAT repeat domain-containing protein [Candidatus Sumerlaeota bacterium]|nr:HEAT repeat domain-containing protein [Candidatus Sumerlaeota bacterium]